MRIINFIFSSVFFLLYVIDLHSITVTAINKTLNKKQVVKQLTLLRLENQMQIIEQVENVAITTFEKLPLTSSVPYIVQARYLGVTYNQIIAPNALKDTKSIEIPVFETTTEYDQSKIQKVSLYSVSYTGNKLAFEIYHHFTNRTSKTFVEKHLNNTKFGIYTLIPLEAENFAASVSVGSGNSNINWLRLNPVNTPLSPKNSYDAFEKYLLPYPLKPGVRTYSIYYEIPYDGSTLDYVIASYYLNSQSIKFIKRPDDIIVQDVKTKKEFPLLSSKDLSWKYHELAENSLKLVELRLSGGTSLKEEKKSSQGGTIKYSTVFNLTESLVISISATLVFFLILLFLIEKPIIFLKYWNLLLYQYRAKLAYLQKYENLNSLKKQEKIQRRIFVLEKNLSLISLNKKNAIENIKQEGSSSFDKK